MRGPLASGEERRLHDPVLLQLLESHTQHLLRQARRIVRDAHLAEELVQEAFARALVQPWAREASPGRWAGFLAVSVRNLAISELRRRRVRPRRSLATTDEPLGTECEPAHEALRAERLALVLDQLGRLPALEAAALRAVELEGLSHERAAAALSVSCVSLRAALVRGRRRLRERCQAWLRRADHPPV